MSDRLSALLDDPECTGDLLLVGVALTACLDCDRRELRDLTAIHRAVWGEGSHVPPRRVGDVLRADVRTYKVPSCDNPRCTAPMTRRPVCNRRGVGNVFLIDYTTGERSRLAH